MGQGQAFQRRPRRQTGPDFLEAIEGNHCGGEERRWRPEAQCAASAGDRGGEGAEHAKRHRRASDQEGEWRAGRRDDHGNLLRGLCPGRGGAFVECVTDNKNRSSAEIRNVFTKNHGSLGTPGSVAHLFSRKGEIRLASNAASEDAVLEAALDAGADDVSSDGDEHVVLTAADRLFAVGDALKTRGLTPKSQKLIQVPLNTIPVIDPSAAARSSGFTRPWMTSMTSKMSTPILIFPTRSWNMMNV